ncbi:MAG TPA: threonine-phosphate decarboxylase CobD [Nitrospirota bacterium]|nr:threonine-phosphate decarboxylase CobD [Nitrospirota bacterium]
MQNLDCEVKNDPQTPESGSAPARVHGENPYTAAKRYGLRIGSFIDFSSNVNPLGPPSSALRAAKRSLPLTGRYPDPEMTDLRRAIARYYGIKPGHVICGCGSNDLIHLIPRIFRPKKTVVPVPTFTEYAVAAAGAGSEVVSTLLQEHDGFRVDPVEMSFAFHGADMAFLCNPNNPTGQLIPRQEMLEIMKFACQQRLTLVVDEAFMDFSDAESIVKEVVQVSRIICIRAFTKFFGMPGLRVGYAVSDEETVSFLRERQEPWPVNIPAEYAAIAAMDDWGYIRKTRRMVEKERERLLSALRLLPGVETLPSAANFILVKIEGRDTHELRDKLGYRGMLVRDCSSFEGLDSRYIRIAVRTKRENVRLIKTLRELLLKK